MTKKKSKNLVAVDSETGIFWLGAQVLRSEKQVNTVIRQTSSKNNANLSQTSRNVFANKNAEHGTI